MSTRKRSSRPRCSFAAADFLDRPTIYRPSIIVGDSQTGYTTTYHGFYAPLKLAHTMASKVAVGRTAGDLLV